MPTTQTYETAYIQAEEPPPPTGPRGYRGPQADPTARIKPKVLLAGSREWSTRDQPRMQAYVNKAVQRAAQQDWRVLVGDNPQGVDAAVVQACDEQGVDCLVYGTQRLPRNPQVLDSEQCRYVQVMKEWVDEIHPGGRFYEPEHRRQLQLMTYGERDERMVESADRVLTIWNGRSPGTRHVFDYAQAQGKPADLAQLEQGRMVIAEHSESATSPAIETVNHDLSQDPAYAAFLKTLDESLIPQEDVSMDDKEHLESIYALCELDPASLEHELAQTMAFRALPTEHLASVGVELAGSTEPSLDQLPYYDLETDTALWVGVVQNLDPTGNAATCVLAVQDVLTDQPQAYLTPCFNGELARAQEVGQSLIDVLNDEPSLDLFFGVVERMAVVNEIPGEWRDMESQILDDTLSRGLQRHVDNQLDMDI